jgi:hypothetical protein
MWQGTVLSVVRSGKKCGKERSHLTNNVEIHLLY